jgi:FAD dependent oxidoreductase TIGR03364
MDKKSAIVVGAGILGLALARALAKKGFDVRVLDRSLKAEGASVRNFGMIWPIGQPEGKLYRRALRSAEIWKEVCAEAGIWIDPVGSLHLAYYPDEWEVLQECQDAFSKQGRKISLVSKNEIKEKSAGVIRENLLGGLFCEEELIVDPRKAIGALPFYLTKKWGVEFCWAKSVTEVSQHRVRTGDNSEFEADCIFICSGADLETLFAEAYAQRPFIKCKLQMMRMGVQPENWRIGPALCGGLSLIHYQSFKVAKSLEALRRRYQDEMKNYLDWGIHVMVSQNQQGELTIGDSHEYGAAIEPFDKQTINNLILDYLRKFFRCRNENIVESWNGIYSKLTDGSTEFLCSPMQGVYLANGVGGAGMTLSFGLAEEIVDSLQ